jgi:hypothetical protein
LPDKAKSVTELALAIQADIMYCKKANNLIQNRFDKNEVAMHALIKNVKSSERHTGNNKRSQPEQSQSELSFECFEQFYQQTKEKERREKKKHKRHKYI